VVGEGRVEKEGGKEVDYEDILSLLSIYPPRKVCFSKSSREMLARNTGMELLDRRVCRTLSSRFAANGVSMSSRSDPPFHCGDG
jgi:hypothetical protein